MEDVDIGDIAEVKPAANDDPVVVDAGYLGSLSDEHLDAMYADIYDLSDAALNGSMSRAA